MSFRELTDAVTFGLKPFMRFDVPEYALYCVLVDIAQRGKKARLLVEEPGFRSSKVKGFTLMRLSQGPYGVPLNVLISACLQHRNPFRG